MAGRAGKYELLSEIGRGGMGVVYRGRSPEGRAVAVKVMMAPDREAVAAFERERRLLWSLTQADGFVPVLDAGEDGGSRWLVMPLLEGGTLRDRLRGAFPPDEAVALVRRLAESLGRAHERGIVHRDLKPENVLFTREGEPLVADLGLAKHFRRDVLGASGSVAISAPGTIVGTPGYMALEQVEGARHVGPQADVFALGVILHECLAGGRPFLAQGFLSYIDELKRGPPALAGRVPGWLAAVVARALATDPGERFVDARTLARALAGRGEGERARPSPWLRVGLAIGTVLLAAAGIAAALVRPGSGRSPPEGAGESASALVRESEAAFDRGDNVRAVALATRAIERDGKLARAWAIRGAARGAQGDWQGDVADSKRAIELDARLGMAWVNRGVARGSMGDLDGEIADETRAVEIDPGLTLAWVNRGAARGLKGDWEGEIADETRAIELAPGLATAWSNRGAARAAKRDWDGAIEDQTRAIELEPRLARAWVNRGSARGSKHDADGEIEDETRAIELAPGSVSAWTSRGAARGDKGDWDGEIEDETRAIELDPGFAQAWCYRGRARARKGDLAGAIADETRAIELVPGYAAPWKIRGIARSRTPDRAGARADFLRFVDLAPGDPEAAKTRDWLRENP